MSVRFEEYTSLIKNLIGPRNGSEETMEKDPRNEYVTGMLEPKDYNRNMEDFGNSDIGTYMPEEEGEGEIIEQSNDFEIHPATFDPRALPKSLGLSFVVTSKEKPRIDVCLVWARYLKSGNVWYRKPENFILNDISAIKEEFWRPREGVRIILNSMALEENVWHVSIYLVNETKFEKFLSTSDLIFQPQIRVHFHDNISAINVDRRKVSGKEEGNLELLFQNLQGLARGHLCGATWKEIDPERPLNGFKENLLVADDILKLDNEDREKFIHPDVRTEYLPAYSINQSTVLVQDIPTMKEDDTSANILAEKWDADELVISLERIAVQYKKWIDEQKQATDTIHDSKKDIAIENLDRCEESSARILEGVKLLKEKEDVRLAFCFMNKVMNTQSEWSRKKNLIWRPFQMGFILQCIPGIENRHHEDRALCDLLWYPTGGGKTEAYLGLMIFTLALRRLRGEKEGLSPYGTTIISRYTLRLLTIQQFRRVLSAITAAEYLRTTKWLPENVKSEAGWGTSPFSVGLWLGSEITPNNVVDHTGWDNTRKISTRYVGANSILKYTHKRSGRAGERVSSSGSEPAQVLKCPCCSALMSIPNAGYFGNEHELFWIVKSEQTPSASVEQLDYGNFHISEFDVNELKSPNYYCIRIKFTANNEKINDDSINEWWKQHVKGIIKSDLACSAASRPGYFIVTAQDVYKTPVDFELHCPNLTCKLNNVEWSEQIPSTKGSKAYRQPIEAFVITNKENISYSIPIPAYTADAQIYARAPSIIIATVDKFARLPFEPRSAVIFGNANTFDSVWGYYRHVALPDKGKIKVTGNILPVKGFIPPELIIQDELHLIEGPLGSMVGIYETAIDFLARKTIDGKLMIPKYIASTATTREASAQIESLYNRKLRQFPQSGITALDNFFSTTKEGHPLDDQGPGRLYVGVCAPGKGPQTPTIRIWSSIMQQAERIRARGTGEITPELDYFWTVVGYFNAIRELAAARSLYRQDIPEWIKQMDGGDAARTIEDYNLVELNSNINSAKIPAVLDQLEKSGSGVDAVMATSMFGTGVDIKRLSLMVVHGQPKTTSSYIQATGRVGRERGALIVTFLRSTRPRDLDHYEFFTGYHRALHRYVEPVTVAPFSPRACDRALGPVAVSILRNGTFMNNVRINPEWAPETESWKGPQGASGSRRMKSNRSANEITEISNSIEQRSRDQPENRKREEGQISKKLSSDFDQWENIARAENSLFYFESVFNYQPNNPVVLGDEQHEQNKKKMVFKKTPQSMRDVESTTRFSG